MAGGTCLHSQFVMSGASAAVSGSDVYLGQQEPVSVTPASDTVTCIAIVYVEYVADGTFTLQWVRGSYYADGGGGYLVTKEVGPEFHYSFLSDGVNSLCCPVAIDAGPPGGEQYLLRARFSAEFSGEEASMFNGFLLSS